MSFRQPKQTKHVYIVVRYGFDTHLGEGNWPISGTWHSSLAPAYQELTKYARDKFLSGQQVEDLLTIEEQERAR